MEFTICAMVVSISQNIFTDEYPIITGFSSRKPHTLRSV